MKEIIKAHILPTLKKIAPYLIIIIVVILIKSYIVTPILVDGDSMYPTLHNNDFMILNKLSYKTGKIRKSDIVVIDINNKRIIKRVIALPGETIEVKDNILYINGKEIKENYLAKDIETSDIDLLEIPKNTYYVLGDNRSNSTDSRILGPIDKKQIMGKAIFTLFPFSNFGTKR